MYFQFYQFPLKPGLQRDVIFGACINSMHKLSIRLRAPWGFSFHCPQLFCALWREHSPCNKNSFPKKNPRHSLSKEGNFLFFFSSYCLTSSHIFMGHLFLVFPDCFVLTISYSGTYLSLLSFSSLCKTLSDASTKGRI